MPAVTTEPNSVEQQALSALNYLSDEDRQHVLEYIHSLVTLDKIKNDQRSTTQD